MSRTHAALAAALVPVIARVVERSDGPPALLAWVRARVNVAAADQSGTRVGRERIAELATRLAADLREEWSPATVPIQCGRTALSDGGGV